jgi:Zn-dependent M28 family amino/carboxypeptidase
MAPVAAAPALVTVGAVTGRTWLARLAGLVCGGIIASFAHIALSPTVPGANDNLTGVATLLALARALRDRPVQGLRVLLVSTGAEESLMEGMRAFAKRRFGELEPDRTHVLCVDTVGSPHLVLAAEEGMLQVRRYDEAFTELVAQCAEEMGVEVRAGVSMRLGTDGYVALRHGLPAALLMSVDDYGGASNYHWPTDTPERVDYGSLDGAIALCECVVRRLASAANLEPARAASID